MISGEHEDRVRNLKYLVAGYEGLTRMIASVKQRRISLNPSMDEKHDPFLKGEEDAKGLEYFKGTQERRIRKECEFCSLWNNWFTEVPGIGGAIGGRLILMYYYKFVPICKKCGADLGDEFTCPICLKSAKGDGLLGHRIEERDFPTISKWWAFMGRATDDEGKIVKRKAGKKSEWSTKGKTLGYHIGENFIKVQNKYTENYYDSKKKYERTRPEWTKAHRHNAAKNDMVKLFLSHMWQVAREIDGKPITEPYVGSMEGHTVIPPYYW